MSTKKQRGQKGRSPSAAGSAPVLVHDIANVGQWQSEVLESERPAVVDCWAKWCAPCRVMVPIFEDVAKAYGESVGFYRLDTQLNADIALKLNIRSIPTLIIFYRGQVFDVSIGLTPGDRLHKMVRRVLDKHQRVGLLGKLKRLWKKNAADGPRPAVLLGAL